MEKLDGDSIRKIVCGLVSDKRSNCKQVANNRL